MKRRAFGDFCDKKKRESIRQLRLLKQLLESSGMKVVNFLESDGDNDPHIYCTNPTKNGSFEGVRIYKIGDQLAFRVQKESDTHPYGSAYPLPVEDMFQDFLSDEGVDQHKAGKKVIEAINSEIRRFFDKSIEAEREDRANNIDTGQDGAGNVLMRSSGTDYSSLIYNKGN